jgi:hypothetical protein
MAMTAADAKAAFLQIEALLQAQPGDGDATVAASAAALTALATPIANIADAPTTVVLTRLLTEAAAASPSGLPIAEL